MHIIIILLSICCTAYADTVATIYDSPTNTGPCVFETRADMQKWAASTLGGANIQELSYKKQKLVVIFRCYTSGVATSQPYVYVENDGHWVRVLTAMMCRYEMEATIEGNALVLWRLDWLKGKKEKAEYLRFDLRILDAG